MTTDGSESIPPSQVFHEDIEEFRRRRPHYAVFTEKLEGLVVDLMIAEKLEYHHIESRCKDVETFAEKATRPGKNYTKPIDEISDQVGVRITTYYLEDVQKICKFLRQCFAIDEKRSVEKVTSLKSNEFGYLSSHLVVTLSPNRTFLHEWKPFADIVAEIQVRTVLQHAWAVIDTKLRYKRASELPKGLQRRLFRVSAALEMADDQFSQLRQEDLDIRETYQDQISRGMLELRIDAESIEQYLRAEGRMEKYTELAVSAGWVINPFFLDRAAINDRMLRVMPAEKLEEIRREALRDTISADITVLSSAGITSIFHLNEILKVPDDDVISLLRSIQIKCEEQGFRPLAGPMNPITIVVLADRKGHLPPSVMDELRWQSVGREVVREMMFGARNTPN